MWYLESTHDVPLRKLDELCCRDLRIGFLFLSLGEIVSGHWHELPLASSQRQRHHNVNPPLIKRPQTFQGVECFSWHMDDVVEPLEYITLAHIRLGFLIHCWPVVTLSPNSVAQ